MTPYEEKPIKDFVLGIFDGPHATPKESDNGPVFLGIKNVRDGSLDLSDIRMFQNRISQSGQKESHHSRMILYSHMRQRYTDMP